MNKDDLEPEDDGGAGSAPAADASTTGSARVDFPIVGVGASAGGLEAYRQFLAVMPSDPGVALIFVQHLDPSHESMMADLLNRHSPLPVTEAGDDVRIEPNHVYMIPPNKFLRIADHGLFLDEPIRQRGARMPIDYFFRSLAEVQHERAICVVLSGTGTDGTQGLREIKAAGGMAMVQDPRSAEYDGMPRSAVTTGMADFILPVHELPDALLDFVKQPYLRTSDRQPSISQTSPETFSAILNLLLAHTDYDFRCYKTGTIERRIQRRMGLRNVGDPQLYLQHLREDRDELTALFKDLLIGVTRFFRDGHVWESLQENVIAPMVAARGYDEPVRVWVPGCASGEEAYSIAMLFFEEFERQRRSLPLQIYATDLDDDAIEVARAARYPDSIAADVSSERLERFFVASDQSFFTVAKRLRETIVFATQNVVGDPPFSRIDLVSCRNLMIYLDSPIQNRLLEIFHFALKEDGVLLLGTSEATDKSADLFERIPTVERAYRRRDAARSNRAPIEPSPGGERRTGVRTKSRNAEHYHDLAVFENVKNTLLDAFAPPSVLIDRTFNVRYYHGELRDYLDFPKGEPVNELVSLAIKGLKSKLRMALNQALKKNAQVEVLAPRVLRHGQVVSVRITVRPVLRPSGEALLLVSFVDEKPRPAKGTKDNKETPPEDETAIKQLEFEIQVLREDYQSAIEELETSNEELKASNEEVMSMNEELQSTNEELATSREELQSLNEELSTLNSQLQEKLKELESTNNDLSNLLSSTDIATIFLDTELRIRRFTPAAKPLLNVIDSDAGRPFSDLATRIDDPTLSEDSEAVLDDLQPRETDTTTEDGQAFIRRVRPYRTGDNRISGVVVTYSDVSRLRTAMKKLRRRELQQAAVSELGQMAAGDVAIGVLLDEAVRQIAEHMDCGHAKVLQLDDDRRRLTLRAATGFAKAVVGESQVGADRESQAGFTLNEAGPVIVEDLAEDNRFRGAPLLVDHGIVSGVSVVIGTPETPWGVLGVHSTERQDFSIDDVAFVQSVANLLRTVIAEKGLQEQRDEVAERLETVLDATGIATWIWDPETDRAIWDKRMHDAIGLSRDTEPTAAAFVGAIHPEDRPRIRKALETMLAEGETYREEFRIIDGEGSIRWIAGLGSPLMREGKRQIWGVNFDISERVSIETTLAESDMRREMALDAANIGTWEWRPGASEIHLDRRFCALMGLEPADRTMPLSELAKRVHPDDWDRRLAKIERAVEEGSSFENEFRIFRDGEERWMHSSGRLYGAADSGVVVGLTSDITERKREEDRRRFLMAELDHRVKNILSNVNAIARQTGYSTPTPDEFIEALEGRLAAMADAHSLLSVSSWQGVDLRALLDAELSPYVSDAAEQVEIDGERYVVSAKAAATLCLFLHELTTNAAKYGALSGPDNRLSVSWRAGEDDEFVFEWTETCSSPIAAPSHRGFGLSVIEEMTASDLDARVELDFRREGLFCRLTAPNDEVAAKGGQAVEGPDLLPTSDHRRSPPARRRSGPQLRVLVVEDAWTVAIHLKTVLEHHGHVVAGPVGRLTEGLALAQKEGFDAAILDVRLHDELVFPLARELAGRGIPFGFATGYSESGVVPEEFAAHPVLSKPYAAVTVIDFLEDLVRQPD